MGRTDHVNGADPAARVRIRLEESGQVERALAESEAIARVAEAD